MGLLSKLKSFFSSSDVLTILSKKLRSIFNKTKDEIIEEVKNELINPDYYKLDNGLEVIDIIESWGLDYKLGNVLKYLLRCVRKGNMLEDLKKAMWYLQRYIEKNEVVKTKKSKISTELKVIEVTLSNVPIILEIIQNIYIGNYVRALELLAKLIESLLLAEKDKSNEWSNMNDVQKLAYLSQIFRENKELV